jgi:hypothetical protein
VIMTRTRPTACPGSGGGRQQRRVSARGVTCNVDRRGKLNGTTRNTRKATRQIRTKFDIFGHLSLFIHIHTLLSATSLLSITPSIVYNLSQHLVNTSHVSYSPPQSTPLTNMSSNIVTVLPTNILYYIQHLPCIGHR